MILSPSCVGESHLILSHLSSSPSQRSQGHMQLGKIADIYLRWVTGYSGGGALALLASFLQESRSTVSKLNRGEQTQMNL